MTGASFSHCIDNREIGREDLQLMLQSRLGKRVLVLGLRESSLLPPGENFACSIRKIDARIKRRADDHSCHRDNGDGEDEKEEELHLVAKLYPCDELVREIFDFKMLFAKEIFFYDKLVPVLKELDCEFLAGRTESFDVAPEFLGMRLSANPKELHRQHHSLDDGVVVLMDNLKSKGYYTGDKIEGLDLDHSTATIATLARFHAYVIACKQHRPDFFNKEFRAHAKLVPYKEIDGFDFTKLILDMMFADERLAQHEDAILKYLGGPETKKETFEYVADEPWLGLLHFDVWTNNLLFKKTNTNEKAIDVKFLDFQNYAYNSPLRDLPYFLCTSTKYEVMTQHFDQLLDLYYDTFVATLEKLRCDTGAFTRESFNRQLKIDARLEFFHNILAIKFFTAEIDKSTYEPSQLREVVLCSQINKLGLDKWYQILLTYIKQGWM